MATYKGEEINTTPTEAMADNARRGLAWREEYGRGGTEVGVARARDISNRRELSVDTVRRMYSYFARHEVDKQAEGFNSGEDGFPSAGRIAWELWGGDQGKSWTDRIVQRLDSLDDRSSVILEPDTAEETSPMTDEVIEERDADIVRFNHRAMELSASPIDEEKRTVQIAVSSEEPVQRSFGMEILDHNEDAIDLSFLASGRAPLLLDHDPTKQIGVIESVELDTQARRLRAKVRFGRNALASEVFTDVADGIRANISVGYSIEKIQRSDKDTYRAVKWRPVEASIVSIPADPVGSGVGRSYEVPDDAVIESKEETTMSDIDIDKIRSEVAAQSAAETAKNTSAIYELAARHGMMTEARAAVDKGMSIGDFRGMVIEKIGSTNALESQDIGMKTEEVKRFSLLRAVHALANPTDRRAQEAAAFEFECSRAAADQYGRAAQGILLPAEVLRNWKRDLNSADEAALFTDDFRGGDFIDVLRNSSSVMQAGARMLGGLSGDVKIPRKTAAATAAWIATEGGAATESEMTVGSVSMTPKTLGAFTDVTRQLLIQSSLDVEALIRDDLTNAIALAIDKAGLEGSGSSGQPTGILNTSGVTQVTNFAAASPTFAETVTLETALGAANALTGNLAYILPASMYGALKTTELCQRLSQ